MSFVPACYLVGPDGKLIAVSNEWIQIQELLKAKIEHKSLAVWRVIRYWQRIEGRSNRVLPSRPHPMFFSDPTCGIQLQRWQATKRQRRHRATPENLRKHAERERLQRVENPSVSTVTKRRGQQKRRNKSGRR